MRIQTDSRPADLSSIGMEGTAVGRQYAVSPDCILRDGKPYIYRMGELHYSRVPSCDWERELRRMKNGGIDIAASYVFWNHHEREEGVFDFTGNRDIRRFIDCCERVSLPFFLRIGPWAHGEARYGGFPDWLMGKGLSLRSEDPAYLGYVRRLVEQVYAQVGESRNIIGIQVENELTGSPEYLERLRRMLREIGFSAPLWSATGWGRAQLPETLLPMFGGYPEAPWEGHTRPLGPNANYFFSHVREDGVIGEDLLGQASGAPTGEKYAGKYPFLTCELGGGNQNTYHRRPVFDAADIAALAVCKLGSGANGLGYYMYHGGVNPVSRDADGRLVTAQESRETGYPNDCPIVSYDFQSPLGDCGQQRESYDALARLHRFLDAVGETLAPMRPAFPDELPHDLADTVTPRVAVRSDGKRGYLFYNNHIHGGTLPEKRTDVTLLLDGGTLTIPLTLPADGYGVIPFNMEIGGETVRWVRALPVSVTPGRVEFLPLPGAEPEICLPDGSVRPLGEAGRIGTAEVVLTCPEPYTPSPAAPVACERVPNVLSFEAFAHLTRLDGSRLTDRTCEYALRVPEGAETLLIRAEGNVAAAYAMEALPRLLSDHFCDGDVWCVDVRGVRDVRLKVQPLGADDRGTIYFERPVREGEHTPEVRAAAGAPRV